MFVGWLLNVPATSECISGTERETGCLLVGCLTSQQQASVSQGRRGRRDVLLVDCLTSQQQASVSQGRRGRRDWEVVSHLHSDRQSEEELGAMSSSPVNGDRQTEEALGAMSSSPVNGFSQSNKAEKKTAISALSNLIASLAQWLPGVRTREREVPGSNLRST